MGGMDRTKVASVTQRDWPKLLQFVIMYSYYSQYADL